MENVNNSLQMVCLSSLNTRVYVISHCENLQIDDDDVHFNLATDFCVFTFVYIYAHKENHRTSNSKLKYCCKQNVQNVPQKIITLLILSIITQWVQGGNFQDFAESLIQSDFIFVGSIWIFWPVIRWKICDITRQLNN